MALSNGPRHARQESIGVGPSIGTPWRSPGTAPRHARPDTDQKETFPMPILVEEYYLLGGPDRGQISMAALRNRVNSFIVEARTDNQEGVSSYGFNVVDGRVAIYGLTKRAGGQYDVTEDRPIVLDSNSEVQVDTQGQDPQKLMQFVLADRSLHLFAEPGSALRVLAPEDFFIQPPVEY